MVLRRRFRTGHNTQAHTKTALYGLPTASHVFSARLVAEAAQTGHLADMPAFLGRDGRAFYSVEVSNYVGMLRSTESPKRRVNSK